MLNTRVIKRIVANLLHRFGQYNCLQKKASFESSVANNFECLWEIDFFELGAKIKSVSINSLNSLWQNNFFHIFNHLHQNGKQLILTSDRAPVLLQGMEERLLTRFKWGMVAELEKPTVELRKNILRNKIHRDGLQFPPEVIDYIAENVNESVRDLEGIVIAIMARSTIFNKEIDLDLAQHIVHGVVHNETKAVTIDDILKVVCKHFDLEPSAIHTKSRKREVVQADRSPCI